MTLTHSVPKSSTLTSSGRDELLDTLRSAALLRVILWHTFAAAWLSWIFPAMPVMFFIAGNLLATSMRRGTWTKVLYQRSRRILIPLWVYGTAVGMTALWSGTEWGGEEILTWIVPLVDPLGPASQEGWLTSHLWYLRGYLWLLLLAPLLLRAATHPRAATIISLTGLTYLEWGSSAGAPALTGAGRIAAGDLLCYGLFAVLGIAWAKKEREPSQGTLPVGLLLLAGAGGAGIVLYDGIDLNSSYLLLTISGLGALLVLGALQEPLRSAATRAVPLKVGRWVSERAVTIYLWHPAAIVLARESTTGDGILGGAQLLTLTLTLTLLGAILFGWVEDVAARRPPRLWPGWEPQRALWRPATAGAGVLSLAVLPLLLSTSFVGGTSEKLGNAPIPSDRTHLDEDAFAETAPAPEPTLTSSNLDGEKLQVVLATWAETHPEFETVTVAVATPEGTWSSTPSGDRPGGTVPLWSLTKSVTAALVLQEAAAGTIRLDTPIPPVDEVTVPTEKEHITPRELLTHTSGLQDYLTSPAYDDTQMNTPEGLLELALEMPLDSAEGTEILYSNSGYHWLGLLLEEVTGKAYAELVEERIREPHNLELTSREEEPGWLGYSSGGLEGTPETIARWYHTLTFGNVLTPEMRAEMLDLGEVGEVGLGVWPRCPCGTTETGERWASGYGHVVGDSAAYSYPAAQVSMYVQLQPGGHDAMEAAPQLMEALLEELEQP